MYDYEGNYLKSFDNARKIEGFAYKVISKCCNNIIHSYKTFRFSFEKKDKLEKIVRKRKKIKQKD
jgi:hypothetical protein